MKIIDPYDVQDWYASADDLASSLKSICFQSDELHLPEMPYHLQVAISSIAKDDPAADIPIERFSSISFFSLCKGLFLPLSGLADQRATEIFGFACQSKSIASVQASTQLVETFLKTEVGLTFCQKIGCLLGDPFDGRRSLFRRDSLLRLLQSVSLKTRSDVLDELTKVGDIAIVFAKHASVVKREDPLTAAEVLAALRPMPDLSVTNRFELLRSLLERCGRIEAYYLVKLDSPLPLDLIDPIQFLQSIESDAEYEVHADIKVGDVTISGQFDSLDFLNGLSDLSAKKAVDFIDKKGNKVRQDLKTLVRDKIPSFVGRLAGHVQNPAAALAPPGATPQLSFKYKARPLNGIWATAPYLHNGSVPNLDELLKPASKRVKKFKVGSREFDPIKVGFVDDGSFGFDTAQTGNKNVGHEGYAPNGSEYTEAERKQLIEYMKTL